MRSWLPCGLADEHVAQHQLGHRRRLRVADEVGAELARCRSARTACCPAGSATRCRRRLSMTLSTMCALAGLTSSASSMSSSFVRPITCSCCSVRQRVPGLQVVQVLLHDHVAAARELRVLVADQYGVLRLRRRPGSRCRRRSRAGPASSKYLKPCTSSTTVAASPSTFMIWPASSKHWSRCAARMWNSRSPGVDDGAVRRSLQLDERVQLGRARSAEQPVPRVRADARHAGQRAGRYPEADRARQSADSLQQVARDLLAAVLDPHHQEDGRAGQRRQHRLRQGPRRRRRSGQGISHHSALLPFAQAKSGSSFQPGTGLPALGRSSRVLACTRNQASRAPRIRPRRRRGSTRRLPASPTRPQHRRPGPRRSSTPAIRRVQGRSRLSRATRRRARTRSGTSRTGRHSSGRLPTRCARSRASSRPPPVRRSTGWRGRRSTPPGVPWSAAWLWAAESSPPRSPSSWSGSVVHLVLGGEEPSFDSTGAQIFGNTNEDLALNLLLLGVLTPLVGARRLADPAPTGLERRLGPEQDPLALARLVLSARTRLRGRRCRLRAARRRGRAAGGVRRATAGPGSASRSSSYRW